MITMKLPPREEWDLTQKGNPNWTPNKWRLCYYYEFARHPQVRDGIVKKFLPTRPPKQFDEKWALKASPTKEQQAWDDNTWIGFITQFPEWPHKPFKSISDGELEKRLKHADPFGSRHNEFGPAAMQRDLNFLIGEYKKLVKLPRSGDDEELDRYLGGDLYGPLWNGRGTIVTFPGMELACFEIDWSLGIKEICNDFANWVSEHHPKQVPLMHRDSSGNLHRVDSAGELLSVKRKYLPKGMPLTAGLKTGKCASVISSGW